MLSVKDGFELLQKGILLRKGLVQQYVLLDLLNSDRYQRPLVKNTVNIVHRNLDEKALGIVHVGKRKGTGQLFVVDGQNRVAGLKARKEAGLKTPEHILCLVHLNTTYEEEAQLFEKLNTVRPVSGNAKFWTRLQYKAQPEIFIEKSVKMEGFSLDFVQQGRPQSNVGNGIRKMAGLKSAYAKLPNQLRPALEVLREVWGNGDAYLVPHEVRTGEVIFGIAKFLHNRGANEIGKLCKHLKSRAIDLGQIWIESRSVPVGYSRPDQLAEILADHCRGYRIRKAA